MAALHTLKRTNARKATRVGRGGKRGKTSGRGTKGQKARAGHSLRPEQRDIIKKLPKKRGHGKNRGRTVNAGRLDTVAISLGTLAKHFNAGDVISRKTIAKKGMVSARKGTMPTAKIVAGGDAPSKVKVAGVPVSAAARTAIEAAGGSIE